MESGYGRATLTGITCGADIPSTTDVAITAQSSPGKIYIGDVSDEDFRDFTTPMEPSPATIISAPLLQVQASSEADVPWSADETLHFTWQDKENGTVRSTSPSADLAGLTGVAENLSLQVSGGLPIPNLGPLVQGLLNPMIDDLLSELSSVLDDQLGPLGVRFGYMDVSVTDVRCGQSVLVQ
jgi:uncharacterized membrane protein